ncbi:uncharacterized protein PGTG_05036 [Puccinia graminis f. sp. tritici CRL 75-36-700-3]|uniref:Amidohydrolase 3 domain-containing protein n=1 Tax=Puccinia graminis f. sp. tritici (strain CRL 75-36-700-3 / race SCCL) TaxID=418459 RepID=E3K3M3_PUCGT|nr:uncharacterized protein PGTG_05036 [Puccinia graminis f. sp. tritici CRL 75-36-700-3]EFP79080.1 hypothetical protein PGTG_05036 [Puccinia graminis f. sp. tritici CRL 75-36-700-3]
MRMGAEAWLGSELRIRGAYAWNSLLKKNVRLALGSDFPVSSVSPFLGIHAAFTQRKAGPSDNDDHQGWYPSKRIESLQQIIDGFAQSMLVLLASLIISLEVYALENWHGQFCDHQSESI